jgi:methyl-accepting chemotaxis protein
VNEGREHVDHLSEVLENLEADLAEREEAFGERVRGKELVIRVLIFVTVLIALVNLYFVNDLTEEVKAMTQAMNEMNEHFGAVSGRMGSITDTVDTMNDTVHMLPIVAAQMREIAGYTGSLSSDVARIRVSADSVETRVGQLEADTRDMALRFRRVNRSVGQIGADVDQMARPLP